MEPIISAARDQIRLFGENNNTPSLSRDVHQIYKDLETIVEGMKSSKRIIDGCPFLNRQMRGLRHFVDDFREGYLTACAFSHRQSQLVNDFKGGLHNIAGNNRVVAHANREIMKFYAPGFSAENRMLKSIALTVLGKNEIMDALREFRKQFKGLVEHTLAENSREHMDRMIESGTASSVGNLSTYAKTIFMSEAEQMREYPTFEDPNDNELV